MAKPDTFGLGLEQQHLLQCILYPVQRYPYATVKWMVHAIQDISKTRTPADKAGVSSSWGKSPSKLENVTVLNNKMSFSLCNAKYNEN